MGVQVHVLYREAGVKGREGSRTEKAEQGSARMWSQLESSLGLIPRELERRWHQTCAPLRQGGQDSLPCISQSLAGVHSQGESVTFQTFPT